MNVVTKDMRWYGEPPEIAVVQQVLKDPNIKDQWSIWIYDGYGFQALGDANLLYSTWYKSARAAISQARVIQQEDTWKHLPIGVYYGGASFSSKKETPHTRITIESDFDAIQLILTME